MALWSNYASSALKGHSTWFSPPSSLPKRNCPVVDVKGVSFEMETLLLKYILSLILKYVITVALFLSKT